MGGGHNGLVAAAYLAQAGHSVRILERLDHTGGAAVSSRPFAGLDARVSRYAYLVSLLPERIVRELGLRFETRSRSVASYTPTHRDGRDTGLLVARDEVATRSSFAELTGSDRAYRQWQEFYGLCAQVAERIAPTVLDPLLSRAEMKRRFADAPEAWQAIFERPLGEAIEAGFDDDLVRGVVLTDALIGTFSHAHDSSLLQNRCFLYHVIGNGTGEWKIPVGGMGALTDALSAAALAAGASVECDAEVTAISSDGSGGGGEVSYVAGGTEHTLAARLVLANVAPRVLDGLRGRSPAEDPEGAQLKINVLLSRLPRLRSGADPEVAFAGTFHLNEGYGQLQAAYDQAAASELPQLAPAESYCHSLTDPSILSGNLQAQGAHTLTVFGLHAPARIFEAHDNVAAREELCARTLAGLDGYLEEPLIDCVAVDAEGRACIEAKSPLDLEEDLGLPRGNIFHNDVTWPFAATDEAAGTWGVETDDTSILVCGSGAVRGGAVSGIPGYNAARCALERLGSVPVTSR